MLGTSGSSDYSRISQELMAPGAFDFSKFHSDWRSAFVEPELSSPTLGVWGFRTRTAYVGGRRNFVERKIQLQWI